MIESLASILRQYPALAIFLTVGLGFFIGRLKIGSFSLGSVTSVLLVGVLIGQLDIPMSGPIKTVFFMLFLFSIGYSVGPDFFKSLRGQGLKQALFAVVVGSCCFGITFLIAYLMKYNKGDAAGMFSGSQTCSSILGVGGEALGRLGLDPEQLQEQLHIMPVAYAVTYIFGTLGTVILLGNFGPKLLGGYEKVKALTTELEEKLSNGTDSKDPAKINALRPVDYRVYRLTSLFFNTPRTVSQTELMLHEKGLMVWIDRIRHGEEISAARYDTVLHSGDEIVLCGPTEQLIEVNPLTGDEIADSELLSYSLDRIGVVVAHKSIIGQPLSELRKKKFMRGVVIRDCMRAGHPIEINAETVFEKGDRITIMGQPLYVEKAAEHIGHEDRPSIASDLMFVGLAIFIGGLFGALSLWIGNVPISFGTSGGALVAGLVFGWLRSKRPTYGNIPAGALWLMNNLGLNVFIAVVGIEAAPSFIAGIKAIGPMLFVVGGIATLVPLFIGLWLGQKVFKFNPAITLGCITGTRTCTAALGAVQNALGSTLPAIGYTVTYAVSNILLVIWGLLIVVLL